MKGAGASAGVGLGVASLEGSEDCRRGEVDDELTDVDWVVRGAGGEFGDGEC